MWSWWKSWRNARPQVVHQICMREAGQVERAAYTGARAWKDWALNDSDGSWCAAWRIWADASVDANVLAVQPQEQSNLAAQEWHDLWKVGVACHIDLWWCQQCSHHISISWRLARRLWFVDWCVRWAQASFVENLATKVVRYRGSAVVAGCVHATTLMKLALVDSVNHTLKKLSLLFAAVAVDDTRLQTFGKQPASVAPASACDSLDHGARRRGCGLRGFLQEAGDPHKRRECTRNLKVDHACGREIALRAERSRVKVTSLQRRQDRCRPLFDLWC